jgi:hypothetical protein
MCAFTSPRRPGRACTRVYTPTRLTREAVDWFGGSSWCTPRFPCCGCRARALFEELQTVPKHRKENTPRLALKAAARVMIVHSRRGHTAGGIPEKGATTAMRFRSALGLVFVLCIVGFWAFSRWETARRDRQRQNEEARQYALKFGLRDKLRNIGAVNLTLDLSVGELNRLLHETAQPLQKVPSGFIRNANPYQAVWLQGSVVAEWVYGSPTTGWPSVRPQYLMVQLPGGPAREAFRITLNGEQLSEKDFHRCLESSVPEFPDTYLRPSSFYGPRGLALPQHPRRN